MWKIRVFKFKKRKTTIINRSKNNCNKCSAVLIHTQSQRKLKNRQKICKMIDCIWIDCSNSFGLVRAPTLDSSGSAQSMPCPPPLHLPQLQRSNHFVVFKGQPMPKINSCINPWPHGRRETWSCSTMKS